MAADDGVAGGVTELDATGGERRLSRRGQRTRAGLVTAARKVFEADGFSAARVTDIADAAGVAHGSFYTYFASKEDVFRAVIDEVLADTDAATHGVGVDFDNPMDAIADTNQRYFDAYRRNRRMLVILDEVAGFNPAFQVRRRELREEFVGRYTKVLGRLQAQGLARNDIDPYHAACALGAMVDDSLRWWLGRGERHDAAVAVDTLNRLWAGALGLSV